MKTSLASSCSFSSSFAFTFTFTSYTSLPFAAVMSVLAVFSSAEIVFISYATSSTDK